MSVPYVWDLLRSFRCKCESRGWEISEYDEDWVKVGREYHSFFWARRIHPSAFKFFSENSRMSIREDVYYRVIDVAYVAWVLLENPPEDIFEVVVENPALSRKIALYDLSQAYAGSPICVKLNGTDSVVFQEFEKFLKQEHDLTLKERSGAPRVSRKTGVLTA